MARRQARARDHTLLIIAALAVASFALNAYVVVCEALEIIQTHP